MSFLSLALALLPIFARAQAPSAAPAAEAAPLAAAASSQPAPAELEPDQDQQLKQAEALYTEGMKDFKAGEVEKGRSELAKAFELALANVEEPGLSAALHVEFASMLEKIRNWEEPEEDEVESPGLDVPDEALSPASGAAASSQPPFRAMKIEPDNPITQRFLDIYSKRPKQVEEALNSSGRYRGLIETALKEKGLPPELFHLVMAESEYKLDARSYAGAAGLWQFMPQTARKYGLEVSYWVDERYQPEKATQAAIAYLSDLYRWFGDWHLALAAYNRGEGGLGRDMLYSRSPDFSSLSGRNALNKQTNHYVPKFMACVLIGRDPEKFGFHPKYEAPEDYDVVPLPRDLDLGIAAKAAGVPEAQLHRLNPQLRAWCTPKDRPGFEFRVPKGTRELFLANLAKVEDWNPGPTLVRYQVRRGDSLGKIAHLHHTTVRAIMEINKIRNVRTLKPGQTVLIRPGAPRKSKRGRSL